MLIYKYGIEIKHCNTQLDSHEGPRMMARKGGDYAEHEGQHQIDRLNTLYHTC